MEKENTKIKEPRTHKKKATKQKERAVALSPMNDPFTDHIDKRQEEEEGLPAELDVGEKGGQNSEFQADPGPVEKKDYFSPYETTGEGFEDIDVELIHPFTIIPDHIIPSDLRYPVVAKTPQGYFSLDGQNLINGAKERGDTVIKCYVEVIAEHSVPELALRKLALRNKPRGGVAHYAETVRNVELVKQILQASNVDLKGLDHGGRRRGQEFTNDKEKNIVTLLALRLGKMDTSIKKILNVNQFLNMETLNYLAEKQMPKTFFEKVRPNKTWTFAMLTDQGKTNDEITSEISALMRGWCEEFLTSNGKIKPVHKEISSESSPNDIHGDVVDVTEITDDTTPESFSTGGNDQKVQVTPDIPDSGDAIKNVEGGRKKAPVSELREKLIGTQISDQEISINLMPMIQTLEPEVSEETDSLNHVKLDVQIQVFGPLLEAEDLFDPVLYREKLIAAAKALPPLIQRVGRFLNG